MRCPDHEDGAHRAPFGAQYDVAMCAHVVRCTCGYRFMLLTDESTFRFVTVEQGQ